MHDDTPVRLDARRGLHPRTRRSLRVTSVAVFSLATVGVGLWSTGANERTETESIRPGPQVSAIDIELTAGTISLATGGQLLIEVESRSGRLAGTPSFTSEVTDGVLQVTGSCPTFGIGRCTADVAITLPPTVAMDLTTGAGSVDGTIGRASGSVRTGAGSIALTITEDVEELSVATGAGGISLTVPDQPYDVSAHTGIGRTRLDVETDAEASRTIVARSEVGSVTVRADPSARRTSTPAADQHQPAGASGTGPAEPPRPASSLLTDPEDLASFLDVTMAEHLDRFGIAGATVTVVKDGEVTVSEGYGNADLEAGTPVEADVTVFPAASVTKLFTWTAVMQLVERGELDLDGEVNEYLTGFQLPDGFDEPVRVWHLLSHTAGFEDKPMSLAVVPEELTDLETALIRDLPSQDREPGRSTAYSNYGAGLAGHLVAEVSGLSWEDYLDRNILAPLAMTRTSGRQPTPEQAPDGMTKVYRTHHDGLAEADHEIVSLAPFGGMVATSQDMGTFMLAHLQDGRAAEARILQEASAQRMHGQLFTHHPRLDGNAHGFWESTEHGQHVLSHLGDHNSSMTGLWLLPDHDLGIYVAYNSDRGGEARAALWDAFLDRAFPEDQAVASDPAAAAPDDLGRFAGTYGNNRISSTTPGKLFLLLGAMQVTAHGDHLVTDVTGHEPTRWAPAGDDVFVSDDGRSRMVVDAGGNQPTRLHFDGPSTGVFTPMSAWAATSWYDRPVVHGSMVAGSLLLIVSTLVFWPARSILRRRRGTVSSSAGDVARWWAAATGALYLLFLGLLVASLLDVLALEFGASPMLLAALSTGLAAAALTVGALVNAVLVWRNRHGSVIDRIHYTIVTVAFLTLAWQLHHWNLLGFHV